MKQRFPILFAAAFGGISPNLLRLAVSLMGENPRLPELTYLLGLSIFAIMGAVVAWIWEETDFKKAFYLGIGLPALIQMSAVEIRQNNPTGFLDQQQIITDHGSLAEATGTDYFIRSASNAYYQEPEEQKMELKMRRFWRRCSVVYTSGDSTAVETLLFQPGDKLSKTLTIPDFATAFHIEFRQQTSESMVIPRDAATARYEVWGENRLWSGFMVALGLKSNDDLDIIMIERVE